MTRRAIATAAIGALTLLLLPTAASAREPVIAYVEGGVFKLYDAELDADVAAPPIPVHGATFRFAISRGGGYVFYDDAAKKLHLYDRNLDAEVPLPGIDTYAQPSFLTVSGGGLLAFDNNGNGPAVVYNAKTGSFIPTGLPATNDNRQTQLSGNGMFLATTCNDPADCPAPTANSDPFLQNLVSMTDAALPVDAAKDEEDPCTNGDGNLVGWQKQVGMGDKDVFLYDRTVPGFLATSMLNDAANDDTHCSMDAPGDYVALTSNNAFALYDVANDVRVTLPAKPFETNNFHNQILSAPFTPAPKPPPPAATTATTAPKKKCKKRKRKRAEAAKKKKRCKKKRKR